MWPGVTPKLFTLVTCLSDRQGMAELPEGPEHDATCSQQTPVPGPALNPAGRGGLQARQGLKEQSQRQDLQLDLQLDFPRMS